MVLPPPTITVNAVRHDGRAGQRLVLHPKRPDANVRFQEVRLRSSVPASADVLSAAHTGAWSIRLADSTVVSKVQHPIGGFLIGWIDAGVSCI
jgi:hypothetical protein